MIKKSNKESEVKFLTANNFLTRPFSLAVKIKPENNSYKLKIKSDKCLISCISIIKSPKIITTIYASRHNMGIIMKASYLIIIVVYRNTWLEALL